MTVRKKRKKKTSVASSGRPRVADVPGNAVAAPSERNSSVRSRNALTDARDPRHSVCPRMRHRAPGQRGLGGPSEVFSKSARQTRSPGVPTPARPFAGAPPTLSLGVRARSMSHSCDENVSDFSALAAAWIGKPIWLGGELCFGCQV